MERQCYCNRADCYECKWWNGKERAELSAQPTGYGAPLPMSEAPTDFETVILAWHKVWECWVSVRRRDTVAGVFPNDCHWVEATLSTAWPDEAFTHWVPQPPAP